MSLGLANSVAPVSSPEDASATTRVERRSSPAADDQCLADRLRLAFRESGYSVLECVSVTVQHGAVALRGTVPSYFIKQIAQEVVRSTFEVRSLSNRLTVKAVTNKVE